MDAGTNALDILTGRVLNLKLGFIGVVNRSQQDTVINKPILESLKAEAEFFRNHPAYKSIAHRCGTSHLAKTLNQVLLYSTRIHIPQVLVNHIRERLPDMKSKLNTMIGQTQQELASYGDPKVESNENKVSPVHFNTQCEGTPPAPAADGFRSSVYFIDRRNQPESRESAVGGFANMLTKE